MPEGDTIFRTATNMRKWICGRAVTAVKTTVPGLEAQRLVGAELSAVTPRGKHLLMRFSNGLTLHTHMRMTGSWHLYGVNDRWRKPPWTAKFILTCGDRVAVCFSAPVIEMLLPSDEAHHRSLVELGPDVLADGPLDVGEALRRAELLPAGLEVGELLLDQRVVCGIGNIYRCESLFLENVNPWTARSDLGAAALTSLLLCAQRLMRANAIAGSSSGAGAGGRGRVFDAPLLASRTSGPCVYGRAGKPCRVCGTFISFARLGKLPRDVFWCLSCQPPPT